MAAFAVPGELNSFLLNQHINVVFIERRAKRIGVRRLTPLLMRFCMAGSTITRRGELLRSNEIIIGGFCLARKKRTVAKSIVVLRNGFIPVSGICLVGGIIAGWAVIKAGTHEGTHAQSSRCYDDSYPNKAQ